jgi:D-alanine-D-alanine ligase
MGVPRLLEVNPNPGWCWDGHLAKMAAISNISYSRLLEMILQAAEQRLLQSKTEDSVQPVTQQYVNN